MSDSLSVFIGLVAQPSLGGWVEIDADADTTNERVEAVADFLRTTTGNPDPEFHVTDVDAVWDRADVRVSDVSDLALFQVMVTVADRCHVGLPEIVAYLDHVGWGYHIDPDADTIQSSFQDVYRGEWDTERSFAEELVTDVFSEQFAAMGDLANYFDWDAFSRDLFMSDYASYSAPGGRIYVFDNRF